MPRSLLWNSSSYMSTQGKYCPGVDNCLQHKVTYNRYHTLTVQCKTTNKVQSANLINWLQTDIRSSILYHRRLIPDELKERYGMFYKLNLVFKLESFVGTFIRIFHVGNPSLHWIPALYQQHHSAEFEGKETPDQQFIIFNPFVF